jgi:hypothetical protein
VSIFSRDMQTRQKSQWEEAFRTSATDVPLAKVCAGIFSGTTLAGFMSLPALRYW